MSARPALAALAAAALALLPGAAAAAPSPYTGSFELRTGTYRPALDSEFGGTEIPFEKSFGVKRPYAFRLHFAKALPWRLADTSTIEVGAGFGYWQVKGNALDPAGDPTSESTGLRVVPLQLTLTWRLDLLMDRFHVPLVPYARVSLDRYQWWVTGPGGKAAMDGATNGWAWGGGVGFVLDFLDPGMAREMDTDYGVNHTMVTLDVSQAEVSDFGSGKSWDLSDTKTTLTFGLLFAF